MRIDLKSDQFKYHSVNPTLTPFLHLHHHHLTQTQSYSIRFTSPLSIHQALIPFIMLSFTTSAAFLVSALQNCDWLLSAMGGYPTITLKFNLPLWFWLALFGLILRCLSSLVPSASLARAYAHVVAKATSFSSFSKSENCLIVNCSTPLLHPTLIDD